MFEGAGMGNTKDGNDDKNIFKMKRETPKEK